ncbi:type II toxin-antitoxin system RelE family toxin [Flavisolibacter ginsenosidimutans]|uniref:Type II toxin-antitoxin system RelE/ParE family toxin n=1 Tax=Flavisolibacter ginsenosidimutans TaxID=661481 RepID=A0A5B8UEP7_9BACT|nr:type II toxin-antitoxin system RelE/ParE family toxin [Flavisolibacter ginsenosidimutans]QEC54776.1 type II toxin-antitoxin system RelE/ParE family toxin [Flavisolibacter ginsenosidimutans]
MSYTVLIEKKVESFIKKQSKTTAQRITTAISSLAENPRPAGCKKLQGYDNEYRIRIGDIRILYTIEDEIITVTVYKAGYRGSVYK